MIHNHEILKYRRRELRKEATNAEKLLWKELRRHWLGIKFKRQHSIGGYILDFYCPKYKLVIELDGEIHNTEKAKEYDNTRDKFFTDLGYRVIRFLNVEVENNIGDVITKIQSYLK